MSWVQIPLFSFKKVYRFMKLSKKKSITPGTRHQIKIIKNVLSKSTNIIKNLSFNIHRNVGRSSVTGHITVRARGAGVKKIYRNVDRTSTNNLGIIVCSFFNPNNTAYTSLFFDLISYKFFYKNSITSVYTGSILACANKILDLKLGFRLNLLHIPVGVIINNITNTNNTKSLYARSAGTFCQIIQKKQTQSLIRLPSNQIVKISNLCFASIGSISNSLNNTIVLGKAGVNRLKGFRSKVRGIAMNPVDHPHGGRTNGGMPSVTPWSKPCKGKPTVKKKRIFKI